MNNTQFDIDYLRKYVQGKLSTSEMHKIELAAQGDEMLMDIISGLEYEFEHKLSSPIEKIQNQIHEKNRFTVPKIEKKKNSYLYWSIAASIAILLGISIFIYNYNPINIEGTNPIAIHTEENSTETKIVPPTADSVTNTIPTDQEQSVSITQIKPHIKPKNTVINREEITLNTIPITKNIELNKKIENINISSNPNEELIIVYNFNQNKEQHTTNKQEILLAENKDIRPLNTSTIAQQRAKINSLNLNPQSQKILNDILDQQAREEILKQGITSNEVKNVIIPDTSLSNAYTNRLVNSAAVPFEKKKEKINTFESVMLIANSKESAPKSGIKNYTTKLINELSKYTVDSFTFKVQFKIDDNGIPTDIQFLKSSHPKLESHIKKYLSKGEKWNIENGDKEITLEIKK